MKAIQTLTLLTLFLVGLNSIAKDDDDSVTTDTSQNVDATKDLIEKENLVKELEAVLEEKQRAFDERAAELKTARNQLIKESAILREATDRQRQEAVTSDLTFQSLDQLVREIQHQDTLLAGSKGWLATDASPRKGYIGVLLGAATDNGVPIVEVYKGSSSHIAGVQANDVILSIGSVKLTNIDDPVVTALALVASYKPGSIIPLTLLRDTEEMEVDVATTARNFPDTVNPPNGWFHDLRSREQRYQDGLIGVLLGEATDTGVPIQEVFDGAPADIAGIRVGDEIIAVGKIELSEIDNATAFTSAFTALKQPGSIIHLTIKRDRKTLDLNVAVIDRYPRSASGKSYIGVLLGEAIDRGVPIVEAYKGSSSHIAGVQAGDIILSVGDVELANVDDPVVSTLAVVASYKPGSIIPLTLLRDTEEMEVDVATTARNFPDTVNPPNGWFHDPRSRAQRHQDGVIGVLLSEATDTGVPIQEVYTGAPADIAGIQADDEILAVGNIELSDLDNPAAFAGAFIGLKQPGSIIHLTIKRDRKRQDTSVAVIDRDSLNVFPSPTSAWATTLENVWNPETGGYTEFSGTGGPTYTLRVPSTDNKIFVMEIEEEFGDYFNVEYGVLVLKAGDVEGIQAGDILLEIDEKPVRSLSQAFRHKQDADSDVEILLKRNKREKSVTLDKDKFSLQAILE